MRSLLQERIGHSITLDQFGDTALVGVLINVQDDYATLYTDGKQLVHYPYAQIKSICTNIAEYGTYVSWMEQPFPPSFQEVLATLRNRVIKVENGEGTVTGLLISVQDGFLKIVKSDREMIYYPVGQLKNISAVILYPKTDSKTESDASKSAETAVSTAAQDVKEVLQEVAATVEIPSPTLEPTPERSDEGLEGFSPRHTIYSLAEPLNLLQKRQISKAQPQLDPEPESIPESPLSLHIDLLAPSPLVSANDEKIYDEPEDEEQEDTLDFNSLSSTWFASDRPSSQTFPNIYPFPPRKKSRKRKMVCSGN